MQHEFVLGESTGESESLWFSNDAYNIGESVPSNISDDEESESEGTDEEGEVNHSTDSDARRLEVIDLQENLILSFLSQLANAIAPTDSDLETNQTNAKNTNGSKRRIMIELANRRKDHNDSAPATRVLQFPRKSKGPSIQPIAQLVRVIDASHEALVSNEPLTKRDLFYKDVSLFKSQAVVDSLVDDLAATLDLNRSDLNIRASAKGLFCGSGLSIILRNGEVIQGHDCEASLIPAGEDIANFEFDEQIRWVLVVEKDAVFQTLCKANFTQHPSLPSPGILITGKGYPDVATRQLVKTFSDNLPTTTRILVLVDADPYGLDIASVYKYGSASMKHQNDGLAADRVEWIGVSASDILRLGVHRDAFLPITKHDHKKALSMLRSGRSKLPEDWRQELMHMLHSRRKAEIEVISSAKTISQAAVAGLLDDSQELQNTPQQDRACKQRSTNPLMQYLTLKIREKLELANEDHDIEMKQPSDSSSSPMLQEYTDWVWTTKLSANNM